MLKTIKAAYQSLLRNKARTALTVFGITIGIGVVIVVLSAGQGVKGLILSEVDSFGSNWINIEVKVPSTDQVSQENASAQARGVTITTLTLEDKEAIDNLQNIAISYGGLTSQAVVSNGNEKKQPMIFGVTSEFIDVDQGEIELGRFYTKEEDAAAAPVIVLGYGVAETLFGNDNPVGQKVGVNSKNYTVLGVMEERGATGFFNFDEIVFIPTETVQRRIMGVSHIQFLIAETVDNSIAKSTSEEIRWLVRDRHDIEDANDDDFAVTTQEESVALIGTIFFGITALLVILAAISLVVGGVGIMNVMYVTVVERTFEIGLRKSVGAREHEIEQQFLLEAVLLTFIGGVVGIIGGILLSLIIALLAQSQGLAWEFVISLPSIAIGTTFSIVVGLVFGYFPARRAARMDPITALRNE